MAGQIGKRSVKRKKPSYLYAIMSTTLVLFLIGLFGILFLNAQVLGRHFKESIELTLILKDNISDADIPILKKQIETEVFTKSVKFTSKEDAAADFTAQFNENIEDVLDYNPLFASMGVKLNAAYTQKDSLEWVIPELEKLSQVKGVYYQKALLGMVNGFLRKLGLPLLVLSFILLLIATSLIDNTIKLVMYSQRFLIKSMQLVGATKGFITRPFISRSVANGMTAGLIASLLLALVLVFIQRQLPDLIAMKDLVRFGVVCLAIVLLGILISWWSTSRSVKKYLKMRLDDLY